MPQNIITFYSYKGGVGRSMAMANVAELLYRRGLNVLMVDFDLEAPGLERYFNVPDAKTTPDVAVSRRGLIDLIYSYKDMRLLPPLPTTQENTDAESKSQFPFPVEPLTNFVVPIYASDEGNAPFLTSSKSQIGSLSLITAGRRDGDEYKRYAERLRSLDWDDLFANWDGELFFDWFREEASKLADVVLIDSRTGVTEMGGVCTYQLADVVVMFVTPNFQNLNGTQLMARSLANPLLIKEGRNGRSLWQLFVPSRVESGEGNKLDEFAVEFDKTLGSLIARELKFETSPFIDLKIPYVPYYAFREDVAVREPDQPKAADLVKAISKLTAVLAQLAPVSSRFYELYHRQRSAEDIPLQQQIKAAEELFSQFIAEEQTVARHVLTRLVRIAPPGEGGEDTRLQMGLEEFSGWDRKMIQILSDARLISVEVDKRSGRELIQLSQQGLIREWNTLKQWLSDDREFLLWRQKFRILMADWELHGRRKEDLLTGPRLSAAQERLRERPDDLNASEKAYINESAKSKSKILQKLVAAAVLVAIIVVAVVGYILYASWQAGKVANDAKKRDAAAQFNLSGNDFAAKGDYDKAIQFYNRALQTDDTYAEAYYNRGNAYRKMGEVDKAITDYSRAIRIKPDSAEALNSRGLAYMSKDDAKKAIADYDEAIKFKPEFAEVYFNRANAYVSQSGPRERILADYEQAIKLIPDYAEAFRDRGNYFLVSGDMDRAIADYNEALKKITDEARLYFGLAYAYKAKGDKENAAANFERTIFYSKDPELTVDATRYLKELGVKEVTPSEVKVYIQYNSAQDLDMANSIAEELRKRNYNVDKLQQNGGRTAGDVRYFYDEDKTQAEQIVRLVQGRLSRSRIRIRIQSVYLGNVYKDVPRGQIEVWLPSLPEPEPVPTPTPQILKINPQIFKKG